MAKDAYYEVMVRRADKRWVCWDYAPTKVDAVNSEQAARLLGYKEIKTHLRRP